MSKLIDRVRAATTGQDDEQDRPRINHGDCKVCGEPIWDESERGHHKVVVELPNGRSHHVSCHGDHNDSDYAKVGKADG